jgi:hypothetical protein
MLLVFLPFDVFSWTISCLKIYKPAMQHVETMYVHWLLWRRGGSMVAHLTANPGFESSSSPAHGKLSQSLGGLLPRMAQYRVLASEGRQRYSLYTKNPKNILKKNIGCCRCVRFAQDSFFLSKLCKKAFGNVPRK